MKKIALIILIVVSCRIFSEQRTLSFMMHWFPQAQFAGYIMAYEKGFFREADLDVELLFSDGTCSPLQKVNSGEIDFCTAWLSQAIVLRSNNWQIVNIGQILQKSSLMLVAKRSSGILTPSDMNGKRIGLWSGDFTIQPTAFFKKYDIDFIEIKQSYNIHGFLADAWQVASAMYYNEYYKMILAGWDESDLITFFFDEFDLNFPEDGIYTNETFLRQNEDICKKLCQAVLSGWEYAFQNKEETLQFVLDYCDRYNMQTNYSAQKWMLDVIERSIKFNTSEQKEDWGKISQTTYFDMVKILKDQDLIDSVPNFKTFFWRTE